MHKGGGVIGSLKIKTFFSNKKIQGVADAEMFQIVDNFTSGYSPYGDGTNPATSPIIALGESWAYHGGQYFADKRYRLNSCNYVLNQQGYFVSNASPLSSHQVYLENFNPELGSDPFYWIPKGIFYDMIDNSLGETFPVNDQVYGYANLQFFNALQPDIKSLQSFKARLLQQNNNNQQTQINSLFQQYGY